MAEQKLEIVKKIVLIGDEGQGKSQLLARIARDEYNHSSGSTIGVEFASTPCQPNSGAGGRLQIWDTAGRERYRSLSSSYYRGATLGVFCISANEVIKGASRGKLEKQLEQFRENAGADIPFILVITKCDAKLDDGVSAENIQEAAKQFGADHQFKAVIYTSAKDNQYGDTFDLSKSSKPISTVNLPKGSEPIPTALADELFQQALIVTPVFVTAKDQRFQVSSTPATAAKTKSQKSANGFVGFISRNRWELAIGLGLMLSLGIFFGLYLFIPPAGFVVTAVMLGLMNLGLGLAPSVYLGAFGVPILAAALGFVAGFFGTKAVKHYACAPKDYTELADLSKSSTHSSMRELQPADDQEEENCVVGYFSKLRTCCNPETEGYAQQNAASLSMEKTF